MEIAVTESDKKKAAFICQAVGKVATAVNVNSSHADYEKRWHAHLREHYPTCWKTVLDASRETQRIVYGGCDYSGQKCSGGVILKTCDLEGCVETRGAATQDELDRVWGRSRVNSNIPPRVEPIALPRVPAEDGTAQQRSKPR